jgi:hypothetical protein
VHGHLISVKVSVKRGTSEWMKLDRFTLNESRTKGLDTQTMQSWRTIQKYTSCFGKFFENIPNFIMITFNNTTGTAYIVFGVGNYGKRPKESDVIDVTYTLVDGPKSNRTVANLDVTVSTFAQVSGRTLTAVQYGEDEPDPENYRLDAPLAAREGERPSTQEALDSKLSNAINVADARCFDQSTLATEFGEKYDHPAYMNTLVIAVLPKHGTALSEVQRVSYLAYVESLIMMQEVELWWATPVEFDLDVELNVWPDQDAEAAKAAVSANLLALYGRSRGSLGRNLTQTDYARCLTDAVDTAEFTAGELRTLRRNEYPVLRNLTVTAYWTKRVMRR